MKTLDGIVAAKDEIFELVDTARPERRRPRPRLGRRSHRPPSGQGVGVPAERVERGGRRARHRGTGRRRHRRGDRPGGVHRHQSRTPRTTLRHLAIVAVLDVSSDEMVDRLESLPDPEHRQEVAAAAAGVLVIDNTFTSNPASAAASLEALARNRRRRGDAWWSHRAWSSSVAWSCRRTSASPQPPRSSPTM